MSRRRGNQDYLDRRGIDGGVHRTYAMIEWMCKRCEDRTEEPHRIGVIVRQLGRDMIGATQDHSPDVLRRVDGPNGETKVEAHCPTCRGVGVRSTPQVRWERLAFILDEMTAEGEHLRRFYP